MNKITVLVGQNIFNLSLQEGGSSELGLVAEDGYASKWVYNHESTARRCPEDGKHPRVYQKWLTDDIKYVHGYWGYIISTNSMHTINIISDLVRSGLVPNKDVEVVGLCNKNREIIFKAGLDSEGYLDQNWHIGFLSLD